MEHKIQEFIALVKDVWQTGVFGSDMGSILLALAVFAAFMLVRRLFSSLILVRLRAIVRRNENKFDDELVDALERPLAFVPVILGVFFAAQVLNVDGSYTDAVANVVRTLTVFVVFWATYNFVEPLSFIFGKFGDLFSPALADWMVKALKAAIVFLGGAAILELWGIEVAPLLAGLGLFGVAVALGAQDLFKNLIAGVLILAERRFNPGDWILVSDVVEGTVESIGFRSTVVRRFDKAPVYVPNTKLSDVAVTNFSKMTHRRIYWKIGLEYRTSVDQLRAVRDRIEALILNDPDFAKPPEVPMFVRVDSFNNSSIDMLLYCFTRTIVWGEWLVIKERLALAVKDIVEGEGCSFAFPSQSVYLESVPSERPEVFVPPSREKAETV